MTEHIFLFLQGFHSPQLMPLVRVCVSSPLLCVPTVLVLGGNPDLNPAAVAPQSNQKPFAEVFVMQRQREAEGSGAPLSSSSTPFVLGRHGNKALAAGGLSRGIFRMISFRGAQRKQIIQIKIPPQVF